MGADGTNVTPLTADSEAEDTFPAWSPDGSRIAFTSDRGPQGDEEIFVMNADGTGVLQLTANPGSVDDWWPSWSPDGTRIAFVSDREDDYEVFVMNADGKGVVNATDNEAEDFNPSWARDGRILFTSDRAANLGIEVADVDGSDRVVVARGGGDETSPAFSPDGTKVAYVADRGQGQRIFVASAGGRGLRQLASDRRFEDSDPAWSPDGRRLALVRTDEFGTRYLYTVNADGTGMRFLLEGFVSEPDWSPGGREIAVDLGGDIVVVRANGRGTRLVSGEGESPSWSPDGRAIVFSSDRDDGDDEGGDSDIFVVSPRGGPARQLTDNDVEDLWPDWSPDGRLVAFSRGDIDDLESSLYLMRADGSRQRRIHLQAPSAMPSWQPLP